MRRRTEWRSATCELREANGLGRQELPEAGVVTAWRKAQFAILPYGYPFPLSPIGAIGFLSGFRIQITTTPHFDSST